MTVDNSEQGIELPVRFDTSSGVVTTGTYAQPQHPASRAVILCHGFLSHQHSQTNRRLTELLVSRSIATLRFDWCGMGESTESLEDITIRACAEQLQAAYTFLAQQSIESIGLIGSSFGGFIAILFASRHPRLHALGLKCPVVDFAEVLRHEFGDDGMEHWKQSGCIPNILGGESPIPLPYSFYEDCLTSQGDIAASGIRAPTLIVHGTQDTLIPSHQIDRFLASLQVPAKLELIPGADHYFGRPEDFRLMTLHLAAWMHDHLPSP